MNLELLEEIHNLQEEGMTESEIASSLGMQKNTLIICLRMEKLLSDKYENVISENSSLVYDIKLLKEKIETLQNKNKALTEEIKTYKSLNEVELLEEISNYENSVKEYRVEYNKLQEKYEKIPNFIKRWFE